jgi:formate hydrogenlyase subunit 3/multisubunit Na+/H+ antiporter MnhD subunit
MTGAMGWVVAIPLAGGVLMTALGPRPARWLAAAAMLATLGSAIAVAWSVALHGPSRMPVGGWLAPLGIELRADGLAAVMLVAIGVVGAVIVAHVLASRGRMVISFARLCSLWFFAWAALDALLISGDIFNLYVTLELATLSAVGLVALAADRAALTAALHYLLFALPGSLVYLLGVGIAYGAHSTLDLPTLATRLGTSTLDSLAIAAMTAGLCLKGAVFPFHGWPVPAYANASPVASSLLSGLIGKAPFLVLVRLWLEVIPAALAPTAGTVLGCLGAGAILWGSLHALWQPRLTLVIAYSSVAHTGYLFVWFALGTSGALAGAVVVAVSHAAASASMFVVAGTIARALGHDRVDRMAGLAHRLPVAFFALALAGTSTMGMPPSGGFAGKWLLVRAAFEAGQWWWAAVMLVGSLLAAAYVFRLLRGAFLPIARNEHVRPVEPDGELAALVLALTAIAVGIVPGLALDLLDAGGSS